MNKLQQVRYAAAYTALAQKLDKHIKEFDSDPNTQIRWIWELIQNAKDAPNRFKQTKIKQSLDDTYFTSSHNGDAFEIPQLHSIVAQYSTKKQKNSQATKTTGKYGTGFITTYILSKIIEVSAILKVEIQEDSDDENQNLKKEVKNLKQQNLRGGLQKAKLNNSKNQQTFDSLSNSFKKLSTQDDDIQDFQKRTNLHFKEKKLGQQKKGQSMFYYKKFSIQMDRSYIDRDEQLPKKIEKTEKKLTKIVMEAEYQSTRNPDFSVRDYEQVQRTVDNYDTEFKYKITDKRKFEMIEKTIVVTKQLLPYAFLFNDNLFYYEFIDNRKFKEQDCSFSLTKGQVANIGTNIFLFTYQLQQDYDHKTQKFLTTKIGYIVSYFINNEKAIAAVPVNIDENGIKILKVDDKLPKYFKDFPLIGCSDLKWNAFVNARQFYPNEKRSQLMLSCIDQTNLDKVQTNWAHLYNCLGAVKEIYLFLSHHCKSGLENLLIFNVPTFNFQKEKDYPKPNKFYQKFQGYLLQLIKEICLTKIVPNRVQQGDVSQKAVQLKNLVFIELASDEKQIYNKNKKSHLELSFRANEAFSFLYGEKCTISSQHYAAFYEILNYSSQYRRYLESCKVITFVTVNKSLTKMSDLKFDQFCVLVKTAYLQKLHEIYSLLNDYNQSIYLNFKSKETNLDFNIFLNQHNEFKRLRADKLMFNNLPLVYNQLAKILKIDIKKNLIHKEFRKYFKQNDPVFNFDIFKMENKIISHFQWNKVCEGTLKELYGINHLFSLFRLLITFKCMTKETINHVRRFLEFQKADLYTFKQNVNELHKFKPQVEKRLVALFVEGFTVYFEYITKEKIELKNLLSTKINIKYFDESVDFMKDLMQDKTLGGSLGAIPVKLAWNGTFIAQEQLSKLNDNVSYPDYADIQIYNIGYNLKKNRMIYCPQMSDKLLDQRLVHPLYPKSALKNINPVTYKGLYQPLQQSWFTYVHDVQNKHQILTYISKINQDYLYSSCIDATMREKYQAWKEDIDKRLEKLFNLKLQNKQFQQEPIKEFLYRLIDNKQELYNAQLIFQNNGNALYFTPLCQQLNLVSNGPKMEEPKPNAKI